MNSSCPLCKIPGHLIYEHPINGNYLHCEECEAIFLDKRWYPSKEEEKSRYLEHLNDVDDPRFQAFVSPLVSYVESHFKPSQRGLDFGAGFAPVITRMLEQKGFTISAYDPFFHPNQTALSLTYDYILCCEVIEHFHHPLATFQQLYNLLHDHGTLICKTHLFHPEIDFSQWYYKNDQTHTFIFQRETILKMQTLVGFSSVEIQGRIIIFTK